VSKLAKMSSNERRAFLKFSSRYSTLKSAFEAWEAKKRKAERDARTFADPYEATRRREPTSAEIDARMQRELEELHADAAPVPVEEEVDPEVVAAEEEQRRVARVKDTLRRMRSPVIAEKLPSGATKFKDDPLIRDRPIGSSVHNTKPTGGQ
jgi:hypothetical protein